MSYSWFNRTYVKSDKVCNSITAHGQKDLIHFDKPIYISDTEIIKASSFPKDYNFKGLKPDYICGMSVPPIMIAQISSKIYEQWRGVFKPMPLKP